MCTAKARNLEILNLVCSPPYLKMKKAELMKIVRKTQSKVVLGIFREIVMIDCLIDNNKMLWCCV